MAMPSHRRDVPRRGQLCLWLHCTHHPMSPPFEPQAQRTPIGGIRSAGVSVVVPVYNSADSLAELCQRLQAVLSEAGLDFEIILVDDASRDGSWGEVLRQADLIKEVQGLTLSRNFGQHSALLAGIKVARMATVVTIDDDLQNPPEEIPSLLAALNGDFDVVYGVPHREEHSMWRRVASRVTKLVLAGAMGAETAAHISSFRAFRRDVADAFADYGGSIVNIDVLLTWSSHRFSMVRVRHDDRKIGKSMYTFAKLFTHAVDMIIGFSTLPLRLASLTGFAFTLFGMAVLVYVLGRFALQGTTVAGFPFLASVVAIFSGAQLFAIGIIGEYLARMHTKLTERPAYVVRSRTAPNDSV